MATKREALKAVAMMFNCFNWSGTPEEKQAKLDCYLATFSDLSPEEIVSICLQAVRGEIGNGKFLPSTAELYQAARPKKEKPSPFWRPHQDRFLSSSGNLYISENGSTTIYGQDELAEHGYQIPATTEVLNRSELENREIESLHKLPDRREQIQDARIRELIETTAKKSSL